MVKYFFPFRCLFLTWDVIFGPPSCVSCSFSSIHWRTEQILHIQKGYVATCRRRTLGKKKQTTVILPVQSGICFRMPCLWLLVLHFIMGFVVGGPEFVWSTTTKESQNAHFRWFYGCIGEVNVKCGVNTLSTRLIWRLVCIHKAMCFEKTQDYKFL